MKPADLAVLPVPRSRLGRLLRPSDSIVPEVRWYQRFGLSSRAAEELLTECGVQVDHVTIYRWVPRFTPLPAEPPGHAATPWLTAGRWTRPI